MSRETGTVKWFSNAKGFGFIERTEGDEDVFAHYSAVQGDGYRSLTRGEEVEYTLATGPKGFQAEEIVRLNPPVNHDEAPAQ